MIDQDIERLLNPDNPWCRVILRFSLRVIHYGDEWAIAVIKAKGAKKKPESDPLCLRTGARESAGWDMLNIALQEALPERRVAYTNNDLAPRLVSHVRENRMTLLTQLNP